MHKIKTLETGKLKPKTKFWTRANIFVILHQMNLRDHDDDWKKTISPLKIFLAGGAQVVELLCLWPNPHTEMFDFF